ncbi:hypothetical protein NUW58_g8468 [Xylaria curta]|uniref:Uncharacterized protein n=1 Tax=Xylaria curta TaxID=42375 RepID=A0ACC1N855_9PEZI|nr:hypothetical protein NUW58_g8468 [Xylaria curta]
MSSESITCWPEAYGVGESYTITSDEFKCIDHYLKCDCPSLEADQDVAGVGVIAAFSVSASLTLALTLLCLLLVRSGDNDTSNALDRYLRKRVCDRFRFWLGHERADRWRDISHDMVISLSDQQLVTGTALLIAALTLLDLESITVYHFAIATDLVWFSSNVHILSLIIIRSFNERIKLKDSLEPPVPLRGQSHSRDKRRRSMQMYPTLFRSLLMCITAALLVSVFLISGYKNWYDEFECPAKCTVPYEKGGEPLVWAILSITFTVYEYTYELSLLWNFEWTYIYRLWNCLINNKVVKLARDLLSGIRDRHQNLDRGLGFLSRLFQLFWCFWASETWSIMTQIIAHWFGYNSWSSDRAKGQDLMTEEQVDKENELSFGQLVPLLLLLLLLMQFLESAAEHEADSRNAKRVKTY